MRSTSSVSPIRYHSEVRSVLTCEIPVFTGFSGVLFCLLQSDRDGAADEFECSALDGGRVVSVGMVGVCGSVP